MYAQIKIAVCGNSKIILSNIINSLSRHSSCSEKLVPRSHASYFKCFCHSLRTRKHNDFECGLTSVSHTKFNLVITWKQHVRKHIVTNNPSRLFHHSSKNYGRNKQPMPKLLYIQSPIAWLVNKLNFRMLKWTWDPHFDESEFQRGTKQV
jgi:hypothetical protein